MRIVDNLKIANQLFEETKQYHKALITQAREIDRLRNILQFLVDCVEFAKSYLPEEVFQKWIDGEKTIPELTRRAQIVFNDPVPNPNFILLEGMSSTAGTTISGAYSLITNNYSYLESNQARTDFEILSERYKGLLNSEQDQQYVYDFALTINAEGAEKYLQGIVGYQSLPFDEDPQGPLLNLRSAIRLVLDSLLDQTPLTRKQKAKLTSISRLPAIAANLAKDDNAKVDLLLANNQLNELWKQLSSSKDRKLEREIAESLVSRVTAFLNLIAKTIRT